MNELEIIIRLIIWMMPLALIVALVSVYAISFFKKLKLKKKNAN